MVLFLKMSKKLQNIFFSVCVAVNGRSSEVDPGSSTSSSANERLALKWAVPVNDVELIDGAAGGTLARVLAYGGSGTISGSSSSTGNKRSSLTRTVTPNHLGRLYLSENSYFDSPYMVINFLLLCFVKSICI